MTTDTKALAAAIEAFEREFPALTWSVSKDCGAHAMIAFEVLASSALDKPEEAIRSCMQQVRELYALRTTRREHAAALTAEYGPEVVS